MAKEEKLFSLQCRLRDCDFDDVFRIYLETERGRERKIALITCIVLCVICIVLLIIIKNITFIFYAVGCLIIGVSYYLVPVNRKFIATNKLQFGEQREITFYPHSVTMLELLEEDDTAELSEEEIADAVTKFSTGALTAYENERGFLFADGKISNQFFYIPKRELDAQTVEQLQEFAKERCSGGYQLLEMKSMLAEEDQEQEDTDTDEVSFVADVCEQYYGAGRLHLHDENGQRVNTEDEEDAEEDTDEAPPEDTAEESE